jgi:hypothetical protein
MFRAGLILPARRRPGPHANDKSPYTAAQHRLDSYAAPHYNDGIELLWAQYYAIILIQIVSVRPGLLQINARSPRVTPCDPMKQSEDTSETGPPRNVAVRTAGARRC